MRTHLTLQQARKPCMIGPFQRVCEAIHVRPISTSQSLPSVIAVAASFVTPKEAKREREFFGAGQRAERGGEELSSRIHLYRLLVERVSRGGRVSIVARADRPERIHGVCMMLGETITSSSIFEVPSYGGSLALLTTAATRS